MRKNFFTLLVLIFFSCQGYSQINIIRDGDFSIINQTDWKTTGAFNYNVCTTFPCSPSNPYAYTSPNCSNTDDASGTLFQYTNSIPSDATTAILSFTQRTGTSNPNLYISDYLGVTLESNGEIYPVITLTNLNASPDGCSPPLEIDVSPFILKHKNQSITLKFTSTQSVDHYETVFRIDNVTLNVTTGSAISCITWVNGIYPDPTIASSMEILCSNGIISNSQNAYTVNGQIQSIDVARCLGKALLGSNELTFLDNFPSVFPDMTTLSITDQRYMKLMLYLEYKSIISPTLGSDDISPYSRDYFYPNIFASINKSDAIKAILETWDIKPSIVDYSPCGTGNSSIICDMAVNNKNLPWVEKAHYLGLLTDIITSPCNTGVSFGSDIGITYAQFYVTLARLLNFTRPGVTYDDFFIPNIFYLNNLQTPLAYERGVFNEYSDNGFDIPSGGVGLQFGISYHSNFVELPILNVNIEVENKYLKVKLQPLGGGWTHSYNGFIKIISNTVPNTNQRLLIYWPDGTIHSYLVSQNAYETKGLTDKLTIDSYDELGQPLQVSIRKGHTIFTFKNIDPAAYQVLSLIKITDAHNFITTLEYVKGFSEIAGAEPQILSTVTDSYSGRKLQFSYWPNSNYLQSVQDPIYRVLRFYPDQCGHDLDSTTDAKNQTTKYSYKIELGTFAYRTHLLQSITKPNGNYVSNTYFSRKLKQTQSASYTIKVDAVPNYQSAWSQQTTQVSENQNNQTIVTNYTFDALGNQINQATDLNDIQYEYDSQQRPITQTDKNNGYTKKTSYDQYGYINKIVTIDNLFNDSTKYEYTNNEYGDQVNIKDYNDPTNTYYHETNIYRNVANGDPTSIVEHEGTGGEVRNTYSYNYDGTLSAYVSPTNYQTQFEYNQFGNVSKVLKLSKVTYAPITESYQYDGASRLIQHTDYEGNVTTFNYDANDNPTTTTKDPAGLNLVTLNKYDKNNNLISTISPKGHTTTLTYNLYTDDLTDEDDGTNKKHWAYNQDGSLDSFITKNGFLFKYLYYNTKDFPGTKLTGLLQNDGQRFYNYFDKTKEPFIITSQGKTNHFWYDGSIQRSKWSKPDFISTEGFFTGSMDNVNYSYDNMGRPTYIVYPSYGGKDYYYTYYYDYTTKKLSLLQDRNSFKNYATYEYQKDGKCTKEVYGNGDTLFHHFDDFNREDSTWSRNKRNELLYTIKVGFDKNGKHISEDTKIFYQGQEVTTLPDLMNGQVKSGTYELRNRIQTFDNNTYTSDGSGNVVAETQPQSSYTWSAGYEQLTNATINGQQYTIEYDALGFRKRVNDVYFVVDQQNTGNVVMEAYQNTTPISVFIYGNGLVARVDPATGNAFYYHFDSRGSVIMITDDNGDVVKYYQYDPFGKVYNQGGNISWNNRFQYLGKWGVQTDNPDLYYMKARYYKPSTGRFISEDPKWNTNLYTYGDDDPINNIDPNGMFSMRDEVGIGESFIPIWGNFRQAMYYAYQGNYGLAALNTAFTISDFFGVGEAIEGYKFAKLSAKGGYATFNEFKAAYGSAGKGNAWHHIVEQGGDNVPKFGTESIHNINNLIKLPHGAGSIHAKISGFYSSKQAFTGGYTVRQWLSSQSFQQQYDFGIKILKQFGWTP